MRLYIIIAALVLCTNAQSQTDSMQWSLENCINHALNNNIHIKQQQLTIESQENTLLNAKLNRLPSVSGNAYYRAGFGRVANATDYTISNQTTHYGSIGIDASMPLFAGLSVNNNIKKQKVSVETAKQSLEMTKNDLNINITVAYLQILLDKELMTLAQQQYAITMEQSESASKKVAAGILPKGNLLDLQSQAAKEALTEAQQANSLAISKLALAQMLDLENVETFDIASIDVPEIATNATTRPDEIFKYANDSQPRIKAYQSRVLESEYDVKLANGNLYPTLALIGGWGTSTTYVDGMSDYSLSSDFKDKSNSYIGLSLSIPIFSGLRARTNVKNAKLSVSDAQYALDNERLSLRKEIQQAYSDAQNALKKYDAARQAVESFNESFNYTQNKFEAGLSTALDYNTAKSELIKAQSQLLQSKYEYLLRTKIIDFYMGKSIY